LVTQFPFREAIKIYPISSQRLYLTFSNLVKLMKREKKIIIYFDGFHFKYPQLSKYQNLCHKKSNFDFSGSILFFLYYQQLPCSHQKRLQALSSNQ